MKKIKRFFAGFLSSVMILSAMPAFAASTGSVASDKSIGSDTVQGASTSYEEVGVGSSKTNVYLTVDNSNIKVGVPTTIILNGSPNENGEYVAQYAVSVSGDISGGSFLTVEPTDNEVALQQAGKDDMSATITQSQTQFSSDDLKNNLVTQGTVSATALTAGSWSGQTSFTIQLNQIEWYDITSTIDILNNGDVGHWNKFGAYTESTTYSTINIPVKEGEMFRISGIVWGSDRLALVRTELARNISTYNLVGVPALDSDGTGRVTEEVITIPEGAKWLCLSTYNVYIDYFKVEKYGSDIVDISKNYTDETLSWSFDKVYMTITIDDSNDNLDEIVALSDTYGVPFNYATIPSRLGAPVNNGEIRRDLLLRAQANGSEILAHDIAWMTSASTYNDYYNYYVTNKKTLEDNGFVVNGVIQSGGTDYQTQDFELATKLAYQAGYLYGDEISSYDIYNKRFYNRRIFNDNLTLDQWKAEIDKVADTGSGWINIGTHCYGDVLMDVTQLEEIVKYAQEKGIEITTWNNLYNTCAVVNN